MMDRNNRHNREGTEVPFVHKGRPSAFVLPLFPAALFLGRESSLSGSIMPLLPESDVLLGCLAAVERRGLLEKVGDR